MATQRVGNAGFKYAGSTTGTVTVQLGTRLHDIQGEDRGSRWEAYSVNHQRRAVTTVGSTLLQLDALVRRHDDPAELNTMVRWAMSSTSPLYYLPDLATTTTRYPLRLVSAGPQGPDPDWAGAGEVQRRLQLLQFSSTATSPAPLWALP